jgi:hypothetical protein
MKGAVLLLLIAGVAGASVVGYHIDPVKAAWSGRADPENGVAQTVVACWDSLERIELFAGTKGDTGTYSATVYDGNTQLMTSPGTQDWDCRWVRFEDWNTQVAFTKGKTVTIRFTRGGSDSLEYYYDGSDPYCGYGEMIVGQSIPFPNPYDLACRVFGRTNPTDSSYFGVDDMNFVPWYNPDSANRTRLRHEAADLAHEAGIGSMMIYVKWPELLTLGNDTSRSWNGPDAQLWEVKRANCRPVVNIMQVAKYVSSRQDSILALDSLGDPIMVWDTAVYCAPKNLYTQVTDDANYWAVYIKDLVEHTEADQAHRPWQNPCEFVHTWEIWNEPNDTCLNDLL